MVVLDEMDQLLSQDHSVLYDLFRLPQASPLSWEDAISALACQGCNRVHISPEISMQPHGTDTSLLHLHECMPFQACTPVSFPQAA